MSDDSLEGLKAAHRKASPAKVDKSAKSDKATPAPVATFDEVDVARIINRACTRAMSDLVVDQMATRRILAALAATVQLHQWCIVAQRLEDYSNGLIDFPREEVGSLKVIDELARSHTMYDAAPTDTDVEARDKVDIIAAIQAWSPPI